MTSRTRSLWSLGGHTVEATLACHRGSWSGCLWDQDSDRAVYFSHRHATAAGAWSALVKYLSNFGATPTN